jgi:hypothetical protein
LETVKTGQRKNYWDAYRLRSFFSSNRRKKQWVKVGAKLPGYSSFASVKNGEGLFRKYEISKLDVWMRGEAA